MMTSRSRVYSQTHNNRMDSDAVNRVTPISHLANLGRQRSLSLFRREVLCPTGNSHEEPRWVEGRQPVGASTRMPHNIRMHLTGSSGLRRPPPAGDTGR